MYFVKIVEDGENMRLSHNIASLNLYKQYTKSLSTQSSALQKLTSGYKVNSAKENPNALAESEQMRMQIRGLNMAARNSQDGVSMLQTAEGGMAGIGEMLQRMRTLVVQKGGVCNNADKEKIQQEIQQLKEGIDGLARDTQFNGVTLLKTEDTIYDNNNPKVLKMPIGANVGEIAEIPKYNLNCQNLKDSKMNLSQIDINTNIDDALSVIDSAIETVTGARSRYGAIENRFEENMKDILQMADTVQKSESKIRDADVAEEMMNYAKGGILVNAGIAMMYQCNNFPNDILNALSKV